MMQNSNFLKQSIFYIFVPIIMLASNAFAISTQFGNFKQQVIQTQQAVQSLRDAEPTYPEDTNDAQMIIIKEQDKPVPDQSFRGRVKKY